MSVYTYSEARQNLAQLLEKAKKDSEVIIKRKNGDTFKIVPIKSKKSGLDVKGIKVNITAKEIVKIIREGRERKIYN